jgi:hypothetical protein
MERLLIPKEEARVAVGWGRRAWDYLIASGELPVIHHGARTFIDARALEEFAKRDRPRMVPKAARNPSESTVTSPLPLLPCRLPPNVDLFPIAVHNEEPQPTYQPTHPDSAEREKQLRRRRNADGGQS